MVGNEGRIMVVGDVHNAIQRAEEILRALRPRYDQAIVLGDHPDDYGDRPTIAAATTRSLERPERVHPLAIPGRRRLFPAPVSLRRPWRAARSVISSACAANSFHSWLCRASTRVNSRASFGGAAMASFESFAV
jgi:hypothetical protein